MLRRVSSPQRERTDTVKLTGERPIEGQTPDSLLALHAAGYREVIERLGSGRLLDLGCGLGDGSAEMASADREGLATMGRLVRQIPCFSLQLGTERREIAETIRDFLAERSTALE